MNLAPLRWYWIDTRWGCGGVGVDAAGVVKEGAPIFRKLLGERLDRLAGIYKVRGLGKDSP